MIPTTTAIKRNRVGNIDSGRLLRRHAHLLDMVVTNGCNMLPNRIDFVMRAAELHAIESEIVRRGITTHKQMLVMRNHAAGRTLN